MKKGALIEGIEIVDIAAKGDVIGKKDGVVYLTRNAVPGDVVSLRLRRNKKGMKQGVVEEIQQRSTDRMDPVCAHFQHCGGCNWQNLQYTRQLELKERRVHEQLRRIGGFQDILSEPILGSTEAFEYRNKLEFTFVQERWLTPEEIASEKEIEKGPALGFHVPGRFDWVVHIDACHLQDKEHNRIRNFIFERAQELNISFNHPRNQEGKLRNLVLRNNRKGEWMLLMISRKLSEDVRKLASETCLQFPSIVSCWGVQNDKMNDSYSDCPVELFHGNPNLTETFEKPKEQGNVTYNIGPKSFFQTNSNQAEKLYQIVHEWANIQKGDAVYDLYTGTGSIALFVADQASKVVGIEYVPEAIEDAWENARLNGIENVQFYAGDMKDILTSQFIQEHGAPDVLIADPPRAGMHADVVARILEARPKRIVYVSCDPATQARDMRLLSELYELKKFRPVDMFPHTSHVENVALLELR